MNSRNDEAKEILYNDISGYAKIFKKKITRWLARTFPNVSDKIKTM